MKGWTKEAVDRLNLKSSFTPVPKEKKKHKVRTIPQLVKDLDEIFSIWVRKSNEDDQGIIRCFTCNRIMTFKTAQNGHYIGRQYKAVRWEPLNTAPQCLSCNIFNEGQKTKFKVAIDKKYGEGTAEMLNQKKNNRFQLDRFVLSAMIEDFKTKIKQLNR